ncbi:hypothetical protein LV779_01780 [Streptomyces thinghirensis]|nr:hypothetical protein [Streptomyces thinghirensis]
MKEISGPGFVVPSPGFAVPGGRGGRRGRPSAGRPGGRRHRGRAGGR